MSGSLLNRTNVRKMALLARKELRPGWDADRVGQEFYQHLETHLGQYIIDAIQRHPTVGKTIRWAY